MKSKIKILVIISMVLCSLYALSSLLKVEATVQIMKELFKIMNMSFDVESMKSYIMYSNIIQLIACLVVGAYALIALEKSKTKGMLIGPGVLLILFNGLFGIIAGIMMFCVKEEEFQNNTNDVEIIG